MFSGERARVAAIVLLDIRICLITLSYCGIELMHVCSLCNDETHIEQIC